MKNPEDVPDRQCANCMASNRGSARPANDNSAASQLASTDETVREIDFGIELANFVARTVAQYTPRDLKGSRLLHAARHVEQAICIAASPENREVLVEFARGKIDVLVARNLVSIPGDLEPTPNRGEPSGRARVYILSNAGLSLAAGQLPAAVTNENKGRFDRHVRPLLWQMNVASSTGGGELGAHTEHSFRNHGDDGRVSPQVDSICLVGLRNESAEPTGFAALGDVLSYLASTSIAVLREPIFGMEPPDSSEGNNILDCVKYINAQRRRAPCERPSTAPRGPTAR